jgi:uncharacterized SAM-binding protein YcdF (DUF218 family)
MALVALPTSRGRRRLALRVGIGVIVFIFGYLLVTGVQVWLTSRRSQAVSTQAIVIMGAAQYDGVPSPDLAARLREARALYRRGLAPLIVATGSKERGDRYTEAESSAHWLVDNGVPSSAVVEVGGDDSWANLADAAAVLHRRGDRRVLVVTDGFHEDRSLAIASDVGLEARPVPATGSPISGWSAVPYFAKETIGVAVGRIMGYSHLHSFDSGGGPSGAVKHDATLQEPDRH